MKSQVYKLKLHVCKKYINMHVTFSIYDRKKYIIFIQLTPIIYHLVNCVILILNHDKCSMERENIEFRAIPDINVYLPKKTFKCDYTARLQLKKFTVTLLWLISVYGMPSGFKIDQLDLISKVARFKG